MVKSKIVPLVLLHVLDCRLLYQPPKCNRQVGLMRNKKPIKENVVDNLKVRMKLVSITMGRSSFHRL